MDCVGGSARSLDTISIVDILGSMRKFVVLLFLVARATSAQGSADSAAIRATALDYIDGWWAADSARMASSLHPEMIKRIRNVETARSREWIDNQGTTRLVMGTARSGGRDTPAAQRRSDVKVLDIFQDVASVRVDAGGWIDYLHLVRWRGKWVIINVLWEVRRQ